MTAFVELDDSDLEEIDDIEAIDDEPLVPRTIVAGAPVLVIAEDDPVILDILLRALGPRYTIHAATDGQAAAELLSRIDPPDAIVLDVVMPKMDGLTLAKRLRADPARRRVPLLMLSGCASTLDVVAGINAGARHYVTKPFKISDVEAKIEKMVRR